MNRKEFVSLRHGLDKTQVELAQLLGVSGRAVHSYEQGWRNIPAHVERQLLFLNCCRGHNGNGESEPAPCWELKGCREDKREHCPAWEFKLGNLCWFINGTICEGTPRKDWSEKMKICRDCEAFEHVLS